jgi:hypothetical protein
MSYVRYGAKAFDIEVDIEDPMAWKLVNKMNTLHKYETILDQDLDQKYRQCAYIMKSIRRLADGANEKDDSLLTYPSGLLTLEDPIFAIQNRKTVAYGLENSSLSEGRLAVKQQVQREWQLLKEGRQLADFSDFRQLHHISTGTSTPSASSAAAAEMKEDIQLQKNASEEKEHFIATPMQLSVIHASRGFLDVGDDELFRSAAWVKDAAKSLLQPQQPSHA